MKKYHGSSFIAFCYRVGRRAGRRSIGRIITTCKRSLWGSNRACRGHLRTSCGRAREINTIGNDVHVFRRDQSGDSLNDEYEYALKWKIHDTLGSLGSLEDTFTQVYVCTT